jgi:hypothetical protein
MKGGADIISALSGLDLATVPAAAILVPAGVSFRAWHKHKSKNRTSTSGGGNMPAMGDNMLLQAWLGTAGINQLTATTLIPIGILILLYNMFATGARVPKPRRGGGDSTFSEHPLVSQAVNELHQKHGGELLPSTLVPFGLVLGKDVYKAALDMYRKP